MEFKKYLFWYVDLILLLFLIATQLFSPQNQLLQLIIIAILSMLIIMKSAGYMIFAISDYARKSGLSDYLLGFVIVALCTSLPEISTAIFASLAKKGSLILGDVIGANIIDTTIVLGLVAILGKKLKVGGKKITSVIAIPLALLIVGFDGTLSRIDGAFLIAIFIVYLVILIMQETSKSKLVQDIKFKKIWKDIAIFGFSLAALLLAARWMVFSALQISQMFNIPPFVLGLFVIALGTTIPELTVELKSILAGAKNLAFGDIFGSFITNICLVLGIAALINPIVFDRFTFFSSFGFMILAIFASVFFMNRKHITWKEGVYLLIIYVLFIISQVWINLF